MSNLWTSISGWTRCNQSIILNSEMMKMRWGSLLEVLTYSRVRLLIDYRIRGKNYQNLNVSLTSARTGADPPAKSLELTLQSLTTNKNSKINIPRCSSSINKNSVIAAFPAVNLRKSPPLRVKSRLSWHQTLLQTVVVSTVNLNKFSIAKK